jgi:hypothetical protein
MEPSLRHSFPSFDLRRMGNPLCRLLIPRVVPFLPVTECVNPEYEYVCDFLTVRGRDCSRQLAVTLWFHRGPPVFDVRFLNPYDNYPAQTPYTGLLYTFVFGGMLHECLCFSLSIQVGHQLQSREHV